MSAVPGLDADDCAARVRGAGLKLNEGFGARRRIRLGLDGPCPVPSFEANVCLKR